MKVAILGTRGIPASYSGFETAAEQLAEPPDASAATRSSSTAARTSSTGA